GWELVYSHNHSHRQIFPFVNNSFTFSSLQITNKHTHTHTLMSHNHTYTHTLTRTRTRTHTHTHTRVMSLPGPKKLTESSSPSDVLRWALQTSAAYLENTSKKPSSFRPRTRKTTRGMRGELAVLQIRDEM